MKEQSLNDVICNDQECPSDVTCYEREKLSMMSSVINKNAPATPPVMKGQSLSSDVTSNERAMSECRLLTIQMERTGMLQERWWE